MPRLNVDLDEARDFSALPERDYLCEVTDVSDVKEGENARYVRVEFTVLEPEEVEAEDGTVKQSQGRKFFRNYPVEGEGAGFFVEMWRKVAGEDLPIGEQGVEIDTDDLIGNEVFVMNEQREWQGEVRNNVAQLTAA